MRSALSKAPSAWISLELSISRSPSAIWAATCSGLCRLPWPTITATSSSVTREAAVAHLRDLVAQLRVGVLLEEVRQLHDVAVGVVEGAGAPARRSWRPPDARGSPAEPPPLSSKRRRPSLGVWRRSGTGPTLALAAPFSGPAFVLT